MNKDHIKGKTKEIEGEIQKGAGKLTGDRKEAAKGAAKKKEGEAQQGVGDLKDGVKKILK